MVEYINASFLEILGRPPDEAELQYTHQLSTSERYTWLYNRITPPLRITQGGAAVERELSGSTVEGLVLENEMYRIVTGASLAHPTRVELYPHGDGGRICRINPLDVRATVVTDALRVSLSDAFHTIQSNVVDAQYLDYDEGAFVEEYERQEGSLSVTAKVRPGGDVKGGILHSHHYTTTSDASVEVLITHVFEKDRHRYEVDVVDSDDANVFVLVMRQAVSNGLGFVNNVQFEEFEEARVFQMREDEERLYVQWICTIAPNTSPVMYVTATVSGIASSSALIMYARNFASIASKDYHHTNRTKWIQGTSRLFRAGYNSSMYDFSKDRITQAILARTYVNVFEIFYARKIDLSDPLFVPVHVILRATRTKALLNSLISENVSLDLATDLGESGSVLGIENLHKYDLYATIILSIWNYFRATHDQAWVVDVGYPTASSLAEFLADRLSYDVVDGVYSTEDPSNSLNNRMIALALDVTRQMAYALNYVPSAIFGRGDQVRGRDQEDRIEIVPKGTHLAVYFATIHGLETMQWYDQDNEPLGSRFGGVSTSRLLLAADVTYRIHIGPSLARSEAHAIEWQCRAGLTNDMVWAAEYYDATDRVLTIRGSNLEGYGFEPSTIASLVPTYDVLHGVDAFKPYTGSHTLLALPSDSYGRTDWRGVLMEMVPPFLKYNDLLEDNNLLLARVEHVLHRQEMEPDTYDSKGIYVLAAALLHTIELDGVYLNTGSRSHVVVRSQVMRVATELLSQRVSAKSWCNDLGSTHLFAVLFGIGGYRIRGMVSNSGFHTENIELRLKSTLKNTNRLVLPFTWSRVTMYASLLPTVLDTEVPNAIADFFRVLAIDSQGGLLVPLVSHYDTEAGMWSMIIKTDRLMLARNTTIRYLLDTDEEVQPPLGIDTSVTKIEAGIGANVVSFVVEKLFYDQRFAMVDSLPTVLLEYTVVSSDDLESGVELRCDVVMKLHSWQSSVNFDKVELYFNLHNPLSIDSVSNLVKVPVLASEPYLQAYLIDLSVHGQGLSTDDKIAELVFKLPFGTERNSEVAVTYLLEEGVCRFDDQSFRNVSARLKPVTASDLMMHVAMPSKSTLIPHTNNRRIGFGPATAPLVLRHIPHPEHTSLSVRASGERMHVEKDDVFHVHARLHHFNASVRRVFVTRRYELCELSNGEYIHRTLGVSDLRAIPSLVPNLRSEATIDGVGYLLRDVRVSNTHVLMWYYRAATDTHRIRAMNTTEWYADASWDAVCAQEGGVLDAAAVDGGVLVLFSNARVYMQGSNDLFRNLAPDVPQTKYVLPTVATEIARLCGTIHRPLYVRGAPNGAFKVALQHKTTGRHQWWAIGDNTANALAIGSELTRSDKLVRMRQLEQLLYARDRSHLIEYATATHSLDHWSDGHVLEGYGMTMVYDAHRVALYVLYEDEWRRISVQSAFSVGSYQSLISYTDRGKAISMFACPSDATGSDFAFRFQLPYHTEPIGTIGTDGFSILKEPAPMIRSVSASAAEFVRPNTTIVRSVTYDMLVRSVMYGAVEERVLPEVLSSASVLEVERYDTIVVDNIHPEYIPSSFDLHPFIGDSGSDVPYVVIRVASINLSTTPFRLRVHTARSKVALTASVVDATYEYREQLQRAYEANAIDTEIHWLDRRNYLLYTTDRSNILYRYQYSSDPTNVVQEYDDSIAPVPEALLNLFHVNDRCMLYSKYGSYTPDTWFARSALPQLLTYDNPPRIMSVVQDPLPQSRNGFAPGVDFRIKIKQATSYTNTNLNANGRLEYYLRLGQDGSDYFVGSDPSGSIAIFSVVYDEVSDLTYLTTKNSIGETLWLSTNRHAAGYGNKWIATENGHLGMQDIRVGMNYDTRFGGMIYGNLDAPVYTVPPNYFKQAVGNGGTASLRDGLWSWDSISSSDLYLHIDFGFLMIDSVYGIKVVSHSGAIQFSVLISEVDVDLITSGNGDILNSAELSFSSLGVQYTPVSANDEFAFPSLRTCRHLRLAITGADPTSLQVQVMVKNRAMAIIDNTQNQDIDPLEPRYTANAAHDDRFLLSNEMMTQRLWYKLDHIQVELEYSSSPHYQLENADSELVSLLQDHPTQPTLHRIAICTRSRFAMSSLAVWSSTVSISRVYAASPSRSEITLMKASPLIVGDGCLTRSRVVSRQSAYPLRIGICRRSRFAISPLAVLSSTVSILRLHAVTSSRSEITSMKASPPIVGDGCLTRWRVGAGLPRRVRTVESLKAGCMDTYLKFDGYRDLVERTNSVGNLKRYVHNRHLSRFVDSDKYILDISADAAMNAEVNRLIDDPSFSGDEGPIVYTDGTTYFVKTEDGPPIPSNLTFMAFPDGGFGHKFWYNRLPSLTSRNYAMSMAISWCFFDITKAPSRAADDYDPMTHVYPYAIETGSADDRQFMSLMSVGALRNALMGIGFKSNRLYVIINNRLDERLNGNNIDYNFTSYYHTTLTFRVTGETVDVGTGILDIDMEYRLFTHEYDLGDHHLVRTFDTGILTTSYDKAAILATEATNANATQAFTCAMQGPQANYPADPLCVESARFFSRTVALDDLLDMIGSKSTVFRGLPFPVHPRYVVKFKMAFVHTDGVTYYLSVSATDSLECTAVERDGCEFVLERSASNTERWNLRIDRRSLWLSADNNTGNLTSTDGYDDVDGLGERASVFMENGAVYLNDDYDVHQPFDSYQFRSQAKYQFVDGIAYVVTDAGQYNDYFAGGKIHWVAVDRATDGAIRLDGFGNPTYLTPQEDIEYQFDIGYVYENSIYGIMIRSNDIVYQDVALRQHWYCTSVSVKTTEAANAHQIPSSDPRWTTVVNQRTGLSHLDNVLAFSDGTGKDRFTARSVRIIIHSWQGTAPAFSSQLLHWPKQMLVSDRRESNPPAVTVVAQIQQSLWFVGTSNFLTTSVVASRVDMYLQPSAKIAVYESKRSGVSFRVRNSRSFYRFIRFTANAIHGMSPSDRSASVRVRNSRSFDRFIRFTANAIHGMSPSAPAIAYLQPSESAVRSAKVIQGVRSVFSVRVCELGNVRIGAMRVGLLNAFLKFDSHLDLYNANNYMGKLKRYVNPDTTTLNTISDGAGGFVPDGRYALLGGTRNSFWYNRFWTHSVDVIDEGPIVYMQPGSGSTKSYTDANVASAKPANSYMLFPDGGFGFMPHGFAMFPSLTLQGFSISMVLKWCFIPRAAQPRLGSEIYSAQSHAYPFLRRGGVEQWITLGCVGSALGHVGMVVNRNTVFVGIAGFSTEKTNGNTIPLPYSESRYYKTAVELRVTGETMVGADTYTTMSYRLQLQTFDLYSDSLVSDVCITKNVQYEKASILNRETNTKLSRSIMCGFNDTNGYAVDPIAVDKFRVYTTLVSPTLDPDLTVLLGKV